MKVFKKLLRNENTPFWRSLTNYWSVALYTLVVWDFITDNMLSPIVGPIAAVYVVILTIYSAEKEFERWQDYHTRRHPGEVYVAIWTVLFFSILLATLFFDKSYRMPSEIISTYIAVLGILALTKKSKALYQEKCPSPESHEPAQK